MLLSESSNVVHHQDVIELPSGEVAEALTLRDGLVLILKSDALALYRSLEHMRDPLASGCLAYAELPEGEELVWREGTLVREHRAGYVGLQDGRAMLIAANFISLYRDTDSALRNRDAIVRMELE